MRFQDYSEASSIKNYLKKALSRTGSKPQKDTFLFHYTDSNVAAALAEKKYLWLCPVTSMNDYFESQIIESALGENQQLLFASFSRVEESLAMYKMYSGNEMGNGVMLRISFADGVKILNENKKEDSNLFKARIVRDKKLTGEEIEGDLFWGEVCYKNRKDDTIFVGGVKNSKIKNPLDKPELAGFIKMNGWEYERELRLCIHLDKKLQENERLAIKIPDEVVKNLLVVKTPEFDLSKYSNNIAKIKKYGVDVKESFYTGMVKINTNKTSEAKKSKDNSNIIIKDNSKFDQNNVVVWIAEISKNILRVSRSLENSLRHDDITIRNEKYNTFLDLLSSLFESFISEKNIYYSILKNLGIGDYSIEIDDILNEYYNEITTIGNKYRLLANTKMATNEINLLDKTVLKKINKIQDNLMGFKA